MATLLVFNSTLGPTEETEAQKLLCYVPEDVGSDLKMLKLGLFEALVKFSRYHILSIPGLIKCRVKRIPFSTCLYCLLYRTMDTLNVSVCVGAGLRPSSMGVGALPLSRSTNPAQTPDPCPFHAARSSRRDRARPCA